MPKGCTPKPGAILVFDGTTGHVGIVERVIDSTHVVMSESNYSDNKKLRDWHFFNMRNNPGVKVGKATIKGCGALLGFIYPSVNDKRVKRNTGVDQVEVCQAMVNVRVNPSTKASVFAKGLYCPMGIFNVLEWEEANGYTWAKLDEDQWVACGSWAKIYKAVETKAQLKAKLKELQTKKANLEVDLAKTNKQIKAIEAKLK